jgi:hypothetical protein
VAFVATRLDGASCMVATLEPNSVAQWHHDYNEKCRFLKKLHSSMFAIYASSLGFLFFSNFVM